MNASCQFIKNPVGLHGHVGGNHLVLSLELDSRTYYLHLSSRLIVGEDLGDDSEVRNDD